MIGPVEAQVRRRFDTEGAPASLPRPIRVVGAGSAAVVAVGLVAGPGLVPLAVGAWVAGAMVHRRVVHTRRVAASDVELCELLEAIARRVRADGSLRFAITAAPSPVSPLLSAEWERMTRAVHHSGVVDALDEWAHRAATDSQRLAAAALACAAATGGAPARAVDGVARTLRQRAAIAHEVRALTSQARASAVVIGLAPAVFGAFSLAVDPRALSFVRSPAGVLTIAVGLGLDALGAWWMARLCESVR